MKRLNREQLRNELLRLKRLTPKELIKELNTMHTKAYDLAAKHYQEAMDIVLQPKQKAAVVAKAEEIRELWDGIREVTIEETEAIK